MLSVLFLWHQHQPFYKDLEANRFELPWVRLHATKDYYDMAALLDEFPDLRLNINLVPSLLAQLDEYASGAVSDPFLDLSRKPAAQLTPDDQAMLLKNFFMAHWGNMVDPWPRYRELLDKRGRTFVTEDWKRIAGFFRENDWRDLQVWFNLAWMDPYWREKDPFIRSLFEKDRLYSEEEKNTLLDKHLRICGQVVAKHKELQERGQLEITATPFYHPILPLLCDSEVAREAMPHAQLPKRFRHAEDAREQIARAIQDHHGRFGQNPRGFWPSEGSVSPEAAGLFIEEGVRWIATDEAILAQSRRLAGYHWDDLYEPHVFEKDGKRLAFFFRDHGLSDAIGFNYGGWNPKDAAADFHQRLKKIQERLAEADGENPRPHVVPVILDGENCWEFYHEDGRPFLRELYHLLSTDPQLCTVRASDYLEAHPPTKTLPSLWSGSWINANFGIWIGHPEDNRAWDLLQRTRDFVTAHFERQPTAKNSPEGKKAWESILIAEGSDWCWWYGDDHSSANDEAFDYLFRKHLMNAYLFLGEKPPEDLHLPIKVPRKGGVLEPPKDFLKVVVDGKVSSYFEWVNAGYYRTEAGTTGTMHRAQNILDAIYFGFSLDFLYFRLDLTREARPLDTEEMRFQLIFFNPEGLLVEVVRTLDNAWKISLPGGQAVYEKTLEIALPIKQLPVPQGSTYGLSIAVLKGQLEQERWPVESALTIPVPHAELFDQAWSV